MSKSSYRRDLAKLADELGWCVGLTKNNHFVLERDGCPRIIVPCSPRNPWRTILNTKARLLRVVRTPTQRTT